MEPALELRVLLALVHPLATAARSTDGAEAPLATAVLAATRPSALALKQCSAVPSASSSKYPCIPL
jgi:hypothetical protein